MNKYQKKGYIMKKIIAIALLFAATAASSVFAWGGSRYGWAGESWNNCGGCCTVTFDNYPMDCC